MNDWMRIILEDEQGEKRVDDVGHTRAGPLLWRGDARIRNKPEVDDLQRGK
jgi:hypothetical protein